MPNGKTEQQSRAHPPSQQMDGGKAEAPIDDLFSAQDQLFGGEKANGHVEPKQQKAEEPKPTKQAKEQVPAGRDRANEIFQKVQEQANSEDSEVDEAAGEGAEIEFDGNVPEFDMSQFIEKEDTAGEAEEAEEDEEPGEEDEEAEVEADLSKETNIKNLRQVAGNFKRERDEALAQVESLQQQLEKQPSPEGLNKEVQKLRNRIKQLEPYEFVFALHQNPAFKERYVDAPNNLAGEMQKIATDYGVDAEVVEQILLIDNRRELDETLEEFFDSQSARADLKTLKQKYDGLIKERVEVEKKPQESLMQFHSQEEQREAERNQTRTTHFNTVTKSAWDAALEKAKEVSRETKIYELLEQPGKKDHNEKVVKPTLTNARSMFDMGMVHVEKMIRNKAVPDAAFTQWLAQVCQQAAATQMINHVRWNFYDRYQSLAKEKKEQHSVNRPGISSQAKTSTKSGKKGKKVDGREAAADIFASVIGEE